MMFTPLKTPRTAADAFPRDADADMLSSLSRRQLAPVKPANASANRATATLL